MSCREDLKRKRDTPGERRLRNRLEQIDIRDIVSIQEWVRVLVAALGGVQTIKKDWPRKRLFDEALGNVEFDEYFVRQPLPDNFHVPMDVLRRNDLKIGDPHYEGAIMTEVIRGIVVREVSEQLLDTVFPPRKESRGARRQVAGRPGVSIVIAAGSLIAPYVKATTCRPANDDEDDGGGEVH